MVELIGRIASERRVVGCDVVEGHDRFGVAQIVDVSCQHDRQRGIVFADRRDQAADLAIVVDDDDVVDGVTVAHAVVGLVGGHAHERDHAVWSRRDFLTRMGLAAAGTVLTVGNHTVSAFGQSRLLGALQQAASDRILVLSKGEVVAEFEGERATEKELVDASAVGHGTTAMNKGSKRETVEVIQ